MKKCDALVEKEFWSCGHVHAGALWASDQTAVRGCSSEELHYYAVMRSPECPQPITVEYRLS